MKKIYKYYLPFFLALGMASCSVEAPFQGEVKEGYGELSKFAFELEVSGVQNTNTRASESDLLNDFDIVIQKTGTTPITKFSDKYSKLPDVIALEAGNYTVTATYGENSEAEFDNPHYLGTSEEFEVKKNEITTDIGKIKCYLNNVKVSVKFHPTLVQHMGEDAQSAYVDVKVKDNGGKALRFTKAHTDNETAGYFKHDEENTLVATFHGIVDGVELEETKTFSSVQKGNHYQITFVRHEYNGEESGEVNGKINVDASVTVTNLDTSVEAPQDPILDDKERPSEGDQPGNPGTDPSDPDTPDTPDNPDDNITKPVITPVGVDLTQVNILEEGMQIILYIKSKAQISSFNVHITSTDKGFLDAIDEMIGTDFDLITLDKNDGDLGGSLSELGFPVGDDVSNPSEKDENGVGIIKFEITPDLQTLLGVYSGIHEFQLSVTNELGTTTETLKLKVEE